MRRLLSIAVAVCCAWPAVASAGWGPDVVLGTNSFAAGDQVTSGGDGTIAAVWGQGTGAAQDAMAAVHPPGGPWSVEKISGGADTSTPHIGADTAGDLVAVWLENGYVRASVRPVGGAWQPVAVPLSAGSSSYLDLAVAPDGTAVVVWMEGGVVKMSTRAPGGAFSQESTISGGTSPYYPAVAAGPQSDFLIAFEDHSGNATRVMSAYRPAGGPSFGAPVSVVSSSPSVNNDLYYDAPEPVFNKDGEATVSWLKVLVDNPNNQQFLAWEAKWRGAGAGGTWNPPVVPQQLETQTVNNTLPGPLLDHVEAADASGRTGLVYESLSSGALMFASRASGTGNAFGTPTALAGANSSRPALGSAGSSLLYAQPNPMSIASAPSAGGFGTLDSSPFVLTGTGLDIAVGGDGSGDVWAVYTDKNGSTETLHFRAFDAVAPEARGLSIPATATAGTPVAFSVTPWDALSGATASWDFGDGTTASGASVSHTFASAGTQTVTVTVTDGAGNVTKATGQVAVAAAPAPGPTGGGGGGGGGGGAAPDTTPPVLSAVAVQPKTFRLAALARVARRTAPAIRLTLSEAATVRVTITRVGARKAVARLTKVLAAGKRRIALTRHVAPRAGRYRARLVALDGAGNASKAVTVTFRVKR